MDRHYPGQLSEECGLAVYLVMLRKWLTPSNLISGLLFALLFMLILNHKAKAFVIRSMMAVGFYQPKLPSPTNTGTLVPDLIFKDSTGKVIRLVDEKGKVVFIDLWATWCPYCIAEMPGINELYLKLKTNPNIVFVMVDVDNDFSKSLPFMAKHQYNLPVHSQVGAMPSDLADGTIPTTLVVDKAGRLVYRHVGSADYSNPKMLDYLNQLAAEK